MESAMESIELLLVVYEVESQATQVLDELKALEKRGAVKVLNAAVLARSTQGVTAVREDHDLKTGHGALFGALVGGLVGLLGGPAGALVGAAAGGATGGLVAGKTDLGFADEFLNELIRALKPDRSALLLLVDQGWAERVVQALQGYQGQLYRHALRSDLVERLSGS